MPPRPVTRCSWPTARTPVKGTGTSSSGGNRSPSAPKTGRSTCTIDCNSSPTNPHQGFRIVSGEGAGTLLQGFTIINGMGGGHGTGEGGAVYAYASAITVEFCIIESSRASRGGGIYALLATVNVLDCRIEGCTGCGIYCHSCEGIISGNTITDNTGGLGAGLHSSFSRFLISENTITANTTYNGGGGIYCTGGIGTDIVNNTIADNYAETFAKTGGNGILCQTADGLRIADNVITGNTGYSYGGGISCEYSSPVIEGNRIQGNTAFMGGAVRVLHNSPLLKNNLMTGNHVSGYGGAVHCLYAAPRIEGCTMADNHADTTAGAVYCNAGSTAVITESILWGNTPDQIRTIEPGEANLSWCDIEGGWPGKNNIDADPVFTNGPEGLFYLSQIASGQALDSPCIDSGDPLSELVDGTTRTDQVPDSGTVDLGYHYPCPEAWIRLVTGPGAGYDNPPLVRVYFPVHHGPMEYEFSAYGAPHHGTNVTCGNVNGDIVDEILTGPGPGNIYGPHVRGFNSSGTPLPGLNFLAYGTNKFGVNVAAGDLDGDGRDEVITGAGPGTVFGPHVRGWTYDNTAVTPMPGVNYFAYGTPKWGVNVAAGDIDGDGFDEIVTGAGPGAVFGPHVRGWNADGGEVTAIPAVSFFAYGTLKFGVNVSCGDVDGDGMDEIVTGAGPGENFGPHVRGWNYDGDAVTPLSDFSFFAWLTGSQSYGVNVFTGTDINGDGLDDVIAGRGPDPEADTQVKVFSYFQGEVVEWMAIDAFEGMTHGTNVAAGRF